MRFESILAAYRWPVGESPAAIAQNAETALDMAFATLDDIDEILGQSKSDSEKLRLIKLALSTCTPETASATAALQSKSS